MSNRKKIGILFSHNENWIGGSYYILNLISSFLSLEDKERPEIFVISWKEEDAEIVKKTGYPYVNFLSLYIPYNFLEKILFKLSPNFVKNNIKKKFSKNQLDSLFPAILQEKFTDISNKLFWIADFQEHYYPDFFDVEEVNKRKSNQLQIALSDTKLILSSYSAKKDFEKFYPKNKCQAHVVNFAVTHPNYDFLNIEDLKKKYCIEGKYFISPNQFWKHKNHKVVIDAVKLLKERGHNIQVIFTGKEYDYRNPAYTDELKTYVTENKLSDSIYFLGFIDRVDQLQLMNHSEAVIQPSLFEGWSTVVEDAKAMNQYVIASDIDVHKEQLKKNYLLFNPLSPDELANKLLEKEQIIVDRLGNTYKDSIKKFAEDFLRVVG